MWAPTTIHQGFNIDYVKRIKEVIDIPVITVDCYNDSYLSELVVKKGFADLIAKGRQSIADSHFPNKVAGNKLEEITPCIACLQGCVGNTFCGQPIECLVNTFVGYESQLDTKTDTPKKVIVIGGELVGCETADDLGEQGFDVSIVEAREDIALDIIGEHKIFLFENFKENNVIVHINTKVLSVDDNSVVIEKEGNESKLSVFDTIVLALGSKSYQPFEVENLAKDVYVLGDAI